MREIKYAIVNNHKVYEIQNEIVLKNADTQLKKVFQVH